MTDPETLSHAFARIAPACDGWSLRQVRDRHTALAVRDDVALPIEESTSTGAMVTVCIGRASAYAATSTPTPAALRDAALRARDLARRLGTLPSIAAAPLPRARHRGPAPPDDGIDAAALLAMLARACRAMHGNRIRERHAALDFGHRETLLTSSDGACIRQAHEWLAPTLHATASDGAGGQRRTWGGADGAHQAGPDSIDGDRLVTEAARVAAEAVALLDAPPCPAGRTDLLLMPGQMVLQIHESIGHPLELDRILGDERNYAGGSFVSADMFGSYRYGSELLDVTFDPTVPGELASYRYDDDGSEAKRVHLIRAGLLERPLGGALSQQRAGMPGTANSRASGWNRPPMDRMANINIEPGSTPFEQLVAGIERGVLMDTNRSWSIDQYRNKFQFGCEYAREIRDGRLGRLLRDPGYRGVSATFWRNLRAVGDAGTLAVLGTRYCGKGEPNQLVMCGHASPACVFADVDVFGPDAA